MDLSTQEHSQSLLCAKETFEGEEVVCLWSCGYLRMCVHVDVCARACGNAHTS